MMAAPYFCVALIILYVFGVRLHWFPPMGAYSDGTLIGLNISFVGSALYHFFLPFISLFLVLVGGQAIAMRSMVRSEMEKGYLAFARQMGLPDKKVVQAVVRNALLPQLTTLSMALGLMVGGTLLVEIIFSYPGMGMVLLDAVHKSDYPVIQATVLIVTVNVLVLNLLIDMLVVNLDPRLKVSLRRQ